MANGDHHNVQLASVAYMFKSTKQVQMQQYQTILNKAMIKKAKKKVNKQKKIQ